MLNNTSFVYAAPIFQQEDYLLTQCEEISDTMLREDINRIMQEFFADEAQFDFKATVDRQWRTLNIDSTIDSEIDRAVDIVNNDAGWVNRFKSSWVPSKAEELTNKITDIAFNSKTLNRKLERLSQNMADELANKLELVSAESSAYAMDCLQRFVGNQYSYTFVEEFAKKIENSVPDPNQSLASFTPDTATFMKTHKFAFGGAAVFAVTTVTKRLINKHIIERVTQQVISRITGRLGTSVIPVIGEIVGGALIVGDVVNSFGGALPQIQESLKAEEVKETFRQEIASKIEEELRNESSQIAREVTTDIYGEWLDFQKDYRETLSLLGELPEFKNIFDKTTDKSKIYSLVGISLNNMGRSQLVGSIQDGSFERSLSLPEITYKILETSHSLSLLEEWTNLAGSQIDEVVSLELYKHLSPQELDRQLLKEILSLKDSSTISKLSLLDIDSIRKLLMISQPNLLGVADRLTAEDLRRLADHLGELEQSQVNQLVRFLIDKDSSVIKNKKVMTHIIQSRNINAALEFWERQTSLVSLVRDTLNLFTGAISWGLFTDKFGIPIPLMVVFISLPIFLLLMTATWIYRQWLKISQTKDLSETIQNQES